jgi:hypothetical protein
MENHIKAYTLSLRVLEHRLGRTIKPMDLLLYSGAILDTTANVLCLLDSGHEVTLQALIDALENPDATSGGAPGPPPQNGM